MYVLYFGWRNREAAEDGSRITMKVRSDSPEVTSTKEDTFYQFQFEAHHVEKGKRGQKVFVCDICRGIFKRSFSLKRHYLRFHINFAFLSPRDLNNCAIVANSHRVIKNGSSVKSLLYRCHQCGHLLSCKRQLLKHLETHSKTPSSPPPPPLPASSSSSPSTSQLTNGTNRCPRCSTSFSMRKTLKRHMKKNRCRGPVKKAEHVDVNSEEAVLPATPSLPSLRNYHRFHDYYYRFLAALIETE